MKKLISYFTILLSILILGNVKNVLAAEIVSDDIPNSTYIIGKCMFTREVNDSYNGSLSTDVIMLAAKTIDSNRLEDMIIYYKNARGVWVNALTNQKVNIGEKINVEYKNNEIYLMKPTLVNTTLIACGTSPECENFVPELVDGKYQYDLGIKDQNESFTGYEIYEKVGGTYTKIGEGKVHNPEIIVVTVEPGEKKTYIARVYAEKVTGEKVYSEYSNEVVIDHSVLETPTLVNTTLIACGTSPECENFVPELVDGKYQYDLGIKDQNESFTGYEIYEKVGGTYTKIGEGKVHNPEIIVVTVEPGEKKTYIARVYAEKVTGEKVYSEYSNEVVIDHSVVETPTLVNTTLIACGTSLECENFVPELVDGKYQYDLGIKDQNESFTGYEIYEKVGGTYTKIGEGKVHNPEIIVVTVEPGEKKTYIARIYAEKVTGEKVYSEYSNEVVIDHSVLETPTLSNPLGVNAETLKAQLTIGYEGAYAISKKGQAITGYELYEKCGLELKLIGTARGLSAIEVTVNFGEKRTFIARVYALNSKNEKVYSAYSNELILEKK